MKELHSEFHTMQTRLTEYVSLTRRIENYQERVNNESSNDIHDADISNSVEDDNEVESESDDIVSFARLARMKKTLENKFQNIDEDVFLLTKKVCSVICNYILEKYLFLDVSESSVMRICCKHIVRTKISRWCDEQSL